MSICIEVGGSARSRAVDATRWTSHGNSIIEMGVAALRQTAIDHPHAVSWLYGRSRREQ